MFSASSSSGVEDADEGMPVPVSYHMVVTTDRERKSSDDQTFSDQQVYQRRDESTDVGESDMGESVKTFESVKTIADFAIDEGTGIVSVAKMLDFETTPVYTLHIVLTVDSTVAYPALANQTFKTSFIATLLPAFCAKGTWSLSNTHPCENITSSTTTTTTDEFGVNARKSRGNTSFIGNCPVVACADPNQTAPNQLSCFTRPYTFVPEGLMLVAVVLLVTYQLHRTKKQRQKLAHFPRDSTDVESGMVVPTSLSNPTPTPASTPMPTPLPTPIIKISKNVTDRHTIFRSHTISQAKQSQQCATPGGQKGHNQT